MQKFEGISFLWALALLALIGCVYGLRAYLGYRQVARDAKADFDYKQPLGMIDKRLSREGYIRAYKRFHNPRSAAYVAGTVAAILGLTWPAMALMAWGLELWWQISGRSRVFEPGFLVWQFLIFFLVIAVWVLIASLGARRYYRSAPISFRDEVLKEIDFEKMMKLTAIRHVALSGTRYQACVMFRCTFRAKASKARISSSEVY